MKRFLSLILSIMCGITLVFASFCVPKSQNSASAADNVFSEETLTDKQDIIGTTGNFANTTALQNAAPFDKENKTMMAGNSYAPTASSSGQINTKINFSSAGTPFEASAGESVYVWIYFPQFLLYELKLGFYTNQQKGIYWLFEDAILLDELNDYGAKGFAYGWRMFELRFADAQLVGLDSAYGTTFNIFEIVYQVPDNTQTSETVNESLSFYHVYKAKSFNRTGVCLYQNYSMFELKESFNLALRNLYINDSIKFNGIYDIFEYVIIGNKDVKNYSDLATYTWSIILNDSNTSTIDIVYGEEYTFKKQGWYSINVKLYKRTTQSGITTNDTVLNTSASFYISEFNMGAFSGNNYFFKVGNRHSVKFTMVEDFVLDSDIVVTVNNKNVASATYYIEGNLCYVVVDLLDVGSAKITLTATGHRDGYSEVKTYTSTLDIHVVYGERNGSQVFLWICFGGFCATLITYGVISFVKARKFGVK